MQPTVEESQLMASKEAIQSAVAAYLAATGAMDANAVAEAFASDGVSNDPVGTAPHKGRNAIRQFMQGILSEAERVTSTPDQIFVAGDSAAFKWTVQLTTKRGRSVTFDGIDVIQVNDDGKIQTLNAYWDPAPVLAALQG
jgi:steroid Delta-isomerase